MKPLLRALPVVAVALLALPAFAHAGVSRAFRGVVLEAAAGQLTLSETRCTPGSSDCGHVSLTEGFDGGTKPRARSAPGQAGFSAGFRISGRGRGTCSAESPPTTLTQPDGSAQFLSGAARLDPGSFKRTRIVVRGAKAGIRIAWLEPFTPGVSCDYFDEPGTALAVPSPATLPSAVVSRGALARSHFSILIAGSREWSEQAADGTNVSGHASWRLRLDYKRSH